MIYFKINKLIKDPFSIIIFLANRRLLNILPDKLFLYLDYYARLRRFINFKHPKRFTEKLQWLKLYYRNPLMTDLADKLKMRNYVANKAGKEYLVPIIEVYEKFDDIDFKHLPNQFVIKCNHNSGYVFICKDKNKFDFDKARRILSKELKKNYYYMSREWPYKNIKRKIIIERYLGTNNELPTDYKFFCFNGEPKILHTVYGRGKGDDIYVDYYDLNWKKLELRELNHKCGAKIGKPKSLNLMIDLCRLLTKGLPFVRLDFYEIGGHPYISEFTFFPGGGRDHYYPEKWEFILGSWLSLPEKSELNS